MIFQASPREEPVALGVVGLVARQGGEQARQVVGIHLRVARHHHHQRVARGASCEGGLVAGDDGRAHAAVLRVADHAQPRADRVPRMRCERRSPVPSVEASSTTMMRSTIAGIVSSTRADELLLVVGGHDDDDTAALEHERVLYTAFMKVAPAIAALCLAAAPAASAELLPEVSVQLRAARYVPVRDRLPLAGMDRRRARPRPRARHHRVLHRRRRDDHRRHAPDLRRQPGQLPPRGRPPAARRPRRGHALLPPRLAPLRRTAPRPRPWTGTSSAARIAWPVRTGPRPVARHGVARPHHRRLPRRLPVGSDRRDRRGARAHRRRGAVRARRRSRGDRRGGPRARRAASFARREPRRRARAGPGTAACWTFLPPSSGATTSSWRSPGSQDRALFGFRISYLR